MKKYTLTFFTIFSVWSAFGQSQEFFKKELIELYKNTVPLISPEELSVGIENKSDLFLLDSRELIEFNVSHIKGARYVGYNEFSLDLVKDIPKNAEIVVYCSLGVRSEKIADELISEGYSNVKNLYGGIFEWVHLDEMVVDENNVKTNKVHVYNKEWGSWLLKGKKVY